MKDEIQKLLEENNRLKDELDKRKEFVLHNGKGVLFGRYSTEEFNKKYSKLREENKKLKDLIPHFKRMINVSREDSNLLNDINDDDDDGSFGDWMIQLDELEHSIKELEEK